MINSKPGRGCPDVTRETRGVQDRIGVATQRRPPSRPPRTPTLAPSQSPAAVPAPLPPDSLTPVITNQTSPHVAETLRDNLPCRHTYYPYSPHAGATSLGLEGEASVAGF
jgi:hypothetical protein